jgi:hypothetical protein
MKQGSFGHNDRFSLQHHTVAEDLDLEVSTSLRCLVSTQACLTQLGTPINSRATVGGSCDGIFWDSNRGCKHARDKVNVFLTALAARYNHTASRDVFLTRKKGVTEVGNIAVRGGGAPNQNTEIRLEFLDGRLRINLNENIHPVLADEADIFRKQSKLT